MPPVETATGDKTTTDSTSTTTNSTVDESKTADATKTATLNGNGADKTIITDGADKGKGTDEVKPDAEKKDTAPEKYEPFKLPEGFVADDEANKSFAEFAKEAGLSQEKAQKAVDLYASVLAKNAKAMQDQFNQMKNEWADETIKGLGPQKDATLALVSKARDTFLSPESIQFLKDSGGGNYLPLVRDLAKIGKAIADDTVVDGGKGGGEKSAAEILYPNQGKN